MSLSDYKKKRTFDKTPEPTGKEVFSVRPLRFVVQKHDASRLHYDFRLEMEGVLKSWAVPKGPSLNPKDKRLAMMVEDHPYEYRNFEGIIPKGNYGAGTVIVWDEGTYEPAEPVKGDKKQQQKALMNQLHLGNLKIKLNGKKLKGEFALVHTKNSTADNAWLLIKKQDEFASTSAISEQDKSVMSNLTIAEVAETSTHEWQSNRSSKKGKVTKTTKTPVKTKDSTVKSPGAANADISGYLEKADKEEAPENLKPMLASLVKEAFNDPHWLFEVKWDGYRAIGSILDGKVELYSRNNISFKNRYPTIVDTLQQWKHNIVVDGEIIILNEKGVPDFQQLQSWQKTGKGNLVYYLFDVLWLDGYSLINLPLRERKEILKQLVPAEGQLKYSDHILERGKDFFDIALDQGLEGVMAKSADSTYHPGIRTQQWLKIKTHKTQEAVIAGFTEARGGRKHFGALILGIYQNNEFIYIGHTGSGLDDKSLSSLYKKLQPLITNNCPFKKKPKTNMAATWVQPTIVCEVKFQEWTKDNSLRIPIFLRLREDKKATEIKKEESVKAENALAVEDTSSAPEKPGKGKKNAKTSAGSNHNKEKEETDIHEPGKKPQSDGLKIKESGTVKKTAELPNAELPEVAKDTSERNGNGSTGKKQRVKAVVLLNAKENEKTVIINKRELKLTNLEKYYWPVEKIAKRDMLNYYHQVAPFILPYMQQRPQSLNRHPQGINGASFYQKDVKDKVADWLTTYKYVSESSGETKEFLVCTDEASLMYTANLGCIEMNPWHSRISSPENPDWCVIDLDPDNISFEKVIEAANVVKRILDALEIDSYCKTSGSTGLHIYIPLGARYDYDQSRQLAELIVNLVNTEIPAFTSLERNPSKRKGKIYLDFLQNRSIQTIAAPYSLRPKPGATVSTPLHWEEVTKGLSISAFTISNIPDRLKSDGDLFKPVLQKGIDMNKVLKKASSIF